MTETTVIQARSGSTKKSPPKRRGRRRTVLDLGEFDREEVISAICEHFCKGRTVREVLEAMRGQYPEITLRREHIYAMVREAAKRGWLRFDPPAHLQLADQLRRKYSWLSSVDVVHSTSVTDVANNSAQTLLRLLKRFRKEGRDTVHIGFAGGHTVRASATIFAELLDDPRESIDNLPESIVLHAMAAGFDLNDPTTGPSAFFSFFVDRASIRVNMEFFGLSAPSMVKPKSIPDLKKMSDIKKAFDKAKDLDIIVTAGTEWTDPHCGLRQRMERESKESTAVLAEKGCVGDLLWRPVGDDGPIETQTDVRALTLVELSDLPAFIRRGKHVLLMLAPCGECHRPKDRLLRCLLEQKEQLVTDLVVDSRSVSQMAGLAS